MCIKHQQKYLQQLKANLKKSVPRTTFKLLIIIYCKIDNIREGPAVQYSGSGFGSQVRTGLGGLQ